MKSRVLYFISSAALAAASLIAVLSSPQPSQAIINGACCHSGGCTVTTSFACGVEFSGVYHGDNSTCGKGECNFCGDGIEDPLEACDDANTSNNDCCKNGCSLPFCGDGFTQGCNKEECDDANTANGDGCTQTCQIEGITTTTLPPSTTTTTLPAFGACCLPSGGCTFATEPLCVLKVNGEFQGDGSSCSEPGICANCGNGSVEQGEECDDGDTASGDGCDDECVVEQCWSCSTSGVTTTTFIGTIPILGPSVCSFDDNDKCDDGDVCTLNDTCSAGVCGGDAVIIPAACEWVIIGGDPSRNVQSRIRQAVTVVGDICGDTDRIGDSSSTTGDIVATASSGKGIFFAANAVVDGDIITDGASVVGKPRDTLLPGLATDEVPGGNTEAQSGDPNDIYDTTGNSPRVEDCNEAQADVDDGAATLDGLAQTQDRGDVIVKGNQTLTINPTVVGGMNVIDFDRLRTGNNATITLDGGGDPDTIYVLRIDRKFDVRLQSDIMFANSQQASHVIFYGRGKCKLGEDVTGGGLVLCPEGKLKMEERVTWGGVLMGGRKRVQVRENSELTHVPLQILAP